MMDVLLGWFWSLLGVMVAGTPMALPNWKIHNLVEGGRRHRQ
jgi:hypothetical protein